MSHKEKEVYNETVKSTNENRILLIENTIKVLEKQKVNLAIDQYELYLILDEAISNAMEHGNKWSHEKKVSLFVFDPVKKYVRVRVADEGQGFDPESIPKKINADSPLSPRGRGILIIKKFCEVEWSNSGKVIDLKVPLKT